MQHVLRCWERQSDGSEYKKTPRRPGLCPWPRWGSLQRSRKPPSWWRGVGCPLPKNHIPRSRPLGPRLSYPHSKISSDALVNSDNFATSAALAELWAPLSAVLMIDWCVGLLVCKACPANTFQCQHGSQCINSSLRCDNKQDCIGDLSDEENCTRTCAYDQFQCNNSVCV